MALHSSIASIADPPQRLLKLLLRVCFSIAGCLWILAYTMHFSTEEVLTSFRLDQYQIYLVLLTLWGYQAKREARRMKAIIDVSESLSKPADAVTLEELSAAGGLRYFGVFQRISKQQSLFPMILSIGLVVVFIALLCKQLILLVG
ncbi:MAG: hypothetical protein ACK5JL_06785 [Candidatus Kapaibacterium sp.]|jgi:hypothetical protein